MTIRHEKELRNAQAKAELDLKRAQVRDEKAPRICCASRNV